MRRDSQAQTWNIYKTDKKSSQNWCNVPCFCLWDRAIGLWTLKKFHERSTLALHNRVLEIWYSPLAAHQDLCHSEEREKLVSEDRGTNQLASELQRQICPKERCSGLEMLTFTILVHLIKYLLPVLLWQYFDSILTYLSQTVHPVFYSTAYNHNCLKVQRQLCS
jgi:hypothetical protein